MRREPARLSEREFDVLVVGAGITGACLACDAARRGLSVAIIDKGDFGAATSAASSKLLHGGLRYMQQLRFGKVRESAFERMYFQNLAPHLAHWVPFVVPTYRQPSKSKALLAAGMIAYEAIVYGQQKVLRDRGRGRADDPGDSYRRSHRRTTVSREPHEQFRADDAGLR